MIKVEFDTKQEWIEARKKCLTGTTVGKYIGITSSFAPKSAEEMAKSPAVQFGVNCEESILTIFKNLPVIAQQTLVIPTLKPTLWYKDDEPRLAGSFDALAWENGQEGFCECKSSGAELYDLKNNIIPDTTFLQISWYFSLNDNFKFCYLVTCSYPQWGNFTTKIDWLRISREDLKSQIDNLKLWQNYLISCNII